jgi:thiosulfate dehydrogenase
MFKEKTIWLVFLSLSILLISCSEPAMNLTNTSFNENHIRNKLLNLDKDDPKSEKILYGKEVFDKTQTTVPDNIGNELSCLSCHGNGGLSPDSPMVGVTEKYPKQHHGKYTTIEDRINGCFVRSMNGKELDKESKEMRSMVAYFTFISQDVDSADDITWRMENKMKDVPEPDITEGGELFTEKNCISCHATDGSGTGDSTGPPLWGDGSFNEAAGINRLSKAAGFIQNNMPKGQAGTLSDQEAADLAAFILSHERPEGDPDAVGDYHKDPDKDYITKDRRKKIRNKQFDWTELDVIEGN